MKKKAFQTKLGFLFLLQMLLRVTTFVLTRYYAIIKTANAETIYLLNDLFVSKP